MIEPRPIAQQYPKIMEIFGGILIILSIERLWREEGIAFSFVSTSIAQKPPKIRIVNVSQGYKDYLDIYRLNFSFSSLIAVALADTLQQHVVYCKTTFSQMSWWAMDWCRYRRESRVLFAFLLPGHFDGRV